MTREPSGYERALDLFEGVVSGVPADGWDRPSPCELWTARDVAGHVIGGQREIIALTVSADPPDAAEDPGQFASDDPLRAWKSARAECGAALTAEALARPIPFGGFGELPLRDLLDTYVLELLVHAWDLAQATGQDVSLDSDLVHRAFATAQVIGASMRAEGLIGPALIPPRGSDELTRLLAFLGRRPDDRVSDPQDALSRRAGEPSGSPEERRATVTDLPDLPDLHRRAIAGMSLRIAAIKPDQWTLPTPCSEWDVHALVNHVTYENLWTPPMFEGRTVAEVGDAYEGDLLGDDPLTAWEASVGPAIGAVSADGAMTRIVHLSFGEHPGRVYASQLFADMLIHSWDVARATGGDELLDPDLVEACLAWFKDQEEGYRAAGAIGPRAEPADDSPQARLLAMFGRS